MLRPRCPTALASFYKAADLCFWWRKRWTCRLPPRSLASTWKCPKSNLHHKTARTRALPASLNPSSTHPVPPLDLPHRAVFSNHVLSCSLHPSTVDTGRVVAHKSKTTRASRDLTERSSKFVPWYPSATWPCPQRGNYFQRARLVMHHHLFKQPQDLPSTNSAQRLTTHLRHPLVFCHHIFAFKSWTSEPARTSLPHHLLRERRTNESTIFPT